MIRRAGPRPLPPSPTHRPPAPGPYDARVNKTSVVSAVTAWRRLRRVTNGISRPKPTANQIAGEVRRYDDAPNAPIPARLPRTLTVYAPTRSGAAPKLRPISC